MHNQNEEIDTALVIEIIINGKKLIINDLKPTYKEDENNGV